MTVVELLNRDFYFYWRCCGDALVGKLKTGFITTVLRYVHLSDAVCSLKHLICFYINF